MDSPWFIYTLADPREPEVVRYVGWTKNVWDRCRSHLRRARGGEKTRCGTWKRALLAEGLEPVLTIIETGSGRGWEETERAWINELGEDVGVLTLVGLDSEIGSGRSSVA